MVASKPGAGANGWLLTVTLAPPSADALDEVEPIYEELEGWTESTVGIREYDALPLRARSYLERIAEIVDTPVDMISTGADRADIIVVRHPFGA